MPPIFASLLSLSPSRAADSARGQVDRSSASDPTAFNGLGPRRGRRTSPLLQASSSHLLPFAVVPSRLPERPQCSRQPRPSSASPCSSAQESAALRLSCSASRRSSHSCPPVPATSARPPRPGPGRTRRAAPALLGLSALLRASPGRTAGRLEHPVAHSAPRSRLGHHQRLVHQSGEQSRTSSSSDVPSRPTASAASSVHPPANTESRPNSIRSARSRAARSSSPSVPLSVRLPGEAVRLPPRQAASGSLRASRRSARRRASHPRRRQLYGQRDAVQPPADLRHGRAFSGLKDEGGIAQPGALHEQPHRLVASSSSSRGRVARGRARRAVGTSHLSSPATPKASRLVARIRKPGARVEQRVHQAGHRVDQVLAVVQDQQHALVLRKTSASVSVSGCSGCSCTPRAAATACGTSAPSESGASSTSHTPSG